MKLLTSNLRFSHIDLDRFKCFIFLDGLHQRCVNNTESSSSDYTSQSNGVTTITRESQEYKSALSQLATTCQQSVLSYGKGVSDAFILQGFNCSTEGHEVHQSNNTKSMHCPAGSICCSGKCYGQIRKVGLIPSIVKTRCDPGQL